MRLSLLRRRAELVDAQSGARGHDASGNRHAVDVGLRKVGAAKQQWQTTGPRQRIGEAVAMVQRRRCRPETRLGLRAVAAECDSLSLRLGTPTISVRCTARNPTTSRAALAPTTPSDPVAVRPGRLPPPNNPNRGLAPRSLPAGLPRGAPAPRTGPVLSVA